MSFITNDKSIKVDVDLEDQAQGLNDFTYFEITVPKTLEKSITF